MDEQTGVEETPTVDTPEGTDTPTVNWEERYKSLQSDYTQKTQKLSQFEKDEDFQQQHFRELADKFGYQLEDPEPVEYDDPSDALTAKLEALEQKFQESQQAQNQQQQLAALQSHVDGQLAQIEGLDKEDADWVIAQAVAIPPREDGMPDIQRAYQMLVERDERAMTRWAQTKRAPHIPSGGKSGTQVPDLDDAQQRQAWMAQQWAASAD